MLKDNYAFSGFSVNNIAECKQFYGDTLGLEIEETPMGLTLKVAGAKEVFVYQKDNHTPASFTILNFVVDDIDQTVKELQQKGVTFEQYAGMTDEAGIARGIAHNMGPDPDIAWFKDPAGNVLSVLHNA